MIKAVYFFLFLYVPSSFAFYLVTNTGAKFDSKNVSIYVTSNSTCLNAGVTPNELLDIAVDGANKFWNKVASSSLKLKEGGILTTTDAAYTSGHLCSAYSTTPCEASVIPSATDIVITCNNNNTGNFTSSGVYAATLPNNLSSSTIGGSIIIINDTATTPFAALSRSEKVNVLAHEIGHAIGIGHSKKSENLMFYQNHPERNRLGQDDIDAVTYLYPNEVSGCDGFFSTITENDNNSSQLNLLSSLLGLILCFGIYAFVKKSVVKTP